MASGVTVAGLSDHRLTYLVKKKHFVKSTKIGIKGRDYKGFDSQALKGKLVNHNLGRFYAFICPIMAWD